MDTSTMLPSGGVGEVVGGSGVLVSAGENAGIHHSQHQPLAHMMPSTVTNRNLMIAFKALVNEMKAKQFDTIRFAAYRTAIKLRYIQHRTFFHLLDVWNVMEAFRLAGFQQAPGEANSLTPQKLDRNRLQEMLGVMYEQLNKRLPAGQQVLVDTVSDILISWLFYSFDSQGAGLLDVSTLKVVLSTLVCAKPVDKFKYHFTVLSDPYGVLVPAKFERYLHDLLMMAVGVFEGTNFAYDPSSSRFMFSGKSKRITMEDFLSRMMTEPGPQCLLWLTIYHRLAYVENVRHTVRCEGCRKESIIGFRYKCQRCHNYNLCQDCFWTGITSGSHTNQHDVKEYTTFKSSHTRSNPFGASLRKSLHCGRPSSVSGGEITANSPSPRVGGGHSTGTRTPYTGASSGLIPPAPSGGQPPPAYSSKTGSAIFQDDMCCGPMGNQLALRSDTLRSVQADPMSTPPVRRHVFSPPPSLQTAFTTKGQIFPPSTPLLHQHQQHSSVDYINTSGLRMASTALPVQSSITSMDAATSGASGGSGHVGSLTRPPYPGTMSANSNSLNTSTASAGDLLQGTTNSLERNGEEHQGIAEYVAMLANPDIRPVDGGVKRDYDTANMSTNPMEIVQELEKKNNEILREIQRIREEQKKTQLLSNYPASLTSGFPNSAATGEFSSLGSVMQSPLPYGAGAPLLSGELSALKQHRDKLESRMGDLKENRRELMQRLESLMTSLKVSSTTSPAYHTSFDGTQFSSGPIANFPPPSSSLLRPKEGVVPFLTSRTNSLPHSSYLSDPAYRLGVEADYGSMQRLDPYSRLLTGNSTVPLSGWTPNMMSGLIPDCSALASMYNSSGALPPSNPNISQAADQLSHRMSNLVRDLQQQQQQQATHNQSYEQATGRMTSGETIPVGNGACVGDTRTPQEWYEATYERALEQPLRQVGNSKFSSEADLGQLESIGLDAKTQRIFLSEQRFMEELRARRRQQEQALSRPENAMFSTDFGDHSTTHIPCPQTSPAQQPAPPPAPAPAPPPPGVRSTSLSGYQPMFTSQQELTSKPYNSSEGDEKNLLSQRHS